MMLDFGNVFERFISADDKNVEEKEHDSIQYPGFAMATSKYGNPLHLFAFRRFGGNQFSLHNPTLSFLELN